MCTQLLFTYKKRCLQRWFWYPVYTADHIPMAWRSSGAKKPGGPYPNQRIPTVINIPKTRKRIKLVSSLAQIVHVLFRTIAMFRTWFKKAGRKMAATRWELLLMNMHTTMRAQPFANLPRGIPRKPQLLCACCLDVAEKETGRRNQRCHGPFCRGSGERKIPALTQRSCPVARVSQTLTPVVPNEHGH